MSKVDIPLDENDKKKLRKQLIPVFIFPFFIIGFFYFIYTMVLKDGMNGMAADGFVLPIFGLFFLFFMGIIGFIIWSYAYDLRKGVKHRIEGVVTDKRLNVHTSSRGTGKNRSTTTTRTYYVYIDNEEYKLDYSGYTKVRVGHHVVVDLTPKSNITLNVSLSENAVDPNLASAHSAVSPTAFRSQTIEAQMNQKDFDALKKIFMKKARTTGIFLLPFIFIIGSLVVNGMSTFLIFLFPIVIIPGVMIFKLVRRFLRYQSDKSRGMKIGKTARVEDKLTITSNRSTNQHTIRTSEGSYAVNALLYDRLTMNDKIVVFQPHSGKAVLSIVTADNQEFYMHD